MHTLIDTNPLANIPPCIFSILCLRVHLDRVCALLCDLNKWYQKFTKICEDEKL